mmetsp:Transcript_28802/g.90775  ORF Transcript_28802/g.90775 Transcript_28802/m.90775 type:complete len:437 (-) Transcript_28802:276-1586(-)
MADEARESPKVVRGYIDGCFDIMHSGHYNAIRQAKAVCDVLVVGVHSDPEIAENKCLPVMRQDERYSLLEHIKWIDEILHDVPYSPEIATLERARADFCVHGDDMPVNAQGVCAYDEMKRAGRLRIVKRTEGVSTTDIIGRLLTLCRDQHSTEHAWSRLPSPSTGLRLGSDDAIEHCARVRCGPGALEEAHALAGELAARYRMSAVDLQRLKDSLGVASESLAEGGAAAPAHDEDSSSLRTSAAVQLLASTRRITEFSSARQPTDEDRVVYVRGSFDMFHVGHAEFLKDARALGTFLLVGINEDLVVSRAKGPHMPVMSLNERVLNVCACKWVDEVIIGAPRGVTEDLIRTWDIHLVARATGHMRAESLGREVADPYAVAQRLGVYAEIPSKWPDLCHATIVERIIGNREKYQKRNLDRARREDAYYAAKDNTHEV